MGNIFLYVICFADDAMLTADSEDNLQRLIHAFNIQAKQLIRHLTSEEPMRCKLEIDGK